MYVIVDFICMGWLELEEAKTEYYKTKFEQGPVYSPKFLLVSMQRVRSGMYKAVEGSNT